LLNSTHAKTPAARSSLEWGRDTGETQIVVADIRNASRLVFLVPGVNGGDAFRDPFRYAP
jgi:hypothetical protein